MSEKKKAGRPVEESPTKIEGTFLDVFKVVKQNKEQNAKKGGNYSLPVEGMGLPVRLQTVLLNAGITNLKELASYHVEEIMQIKGMGMKYISLLEDVISKYNLRFGDFKR